MTQPSSIFFHKTDNFLYLNCIGKGNFINSPALRSVADTEIAEGQRLVVIDLALCTGMDSTFMGTLAGIGRRLIALGGTVQIADPGEKNYDLLENLGLDALLEINPKEAPWRGKLDELREEAIQVDMDGISLKGTAQAKYVLDAHVTLSDISPENAAKFKGVVEGLSKEVKD